MIGFDLDGTLAVTKSPIPDLIAERLADLLAAFDVCVVSGGDFSQFQQQLIARLDVRRADLSAVAPPADDRHEVLPLRPRSRHVVPAVLGGSGAGTS